MTCDTCKFKGYFTDEIACIRYPPQVYGNGSTKFPNIKPNWICGEYKQSD